MDIKSHPNHKKYLQVLSNMTSAEKLAKAIELSNTSKELFLAGLKKRFPDKGEEEIRVIYLERLFKCYNRNY